MSSPSTGKPEEKDESQFIVRSGVFPSGQFPCAMFSDSVIALHNDDNYRMQLIDLDQKKSEGKEDSVPTISGVKAACMSHDRKWFAVYGDHSITVWLADSLKNFQNFTRTKGEVIPVDDKRAGAFREFSRYMHFIGPNNSHIALSYDRMIGVQLSLVNLKTGKQVDNLLLLYADRFYPFGPDSFITTRDRCRGLFLHPVQFGSSDEIDINREGIELLKERDCDYDDVIVSTDRQFIAAHCREPYHINEYFIKRFTVQEDEKAESGYRLIETGKFACSPRYENFYFTPDNVLMFCNRERQLCSVAWDSDRPQIIAGSYDASCAMPNGNILAMSLSGEFNIHSMGGDILRQALTEIVHQAEIAKTTGYSTSLSGLVADMSGGPQFFSRPQKQILEYKDTEKAIVEKVLRKYLKHPLICVSDKVSIHAFLDEKGDLQNSIGAALGYPGCVVSKSMQEFWDDLGVVFGQSKRPGPL